MLHLIPPPPALTTSFLLPAMMEINLCWSESNISSTLTTRDDQDSKSTCQSRPLQITRVSTSRDVPDSPTCRPPRPHGLTLRTDTAGLGRRKEMTENDQSIYEDCPAGDDPRTIRLAMDVARQIVGSHCKIKLSDEWPTFQPPHSLLPGQTFFLLTFKLIFNLNSTLEHNY
ncbi:hypothetical protein Btru_017870 [Bulinus truncatus]|nr:hypothetical protein Btru_017870 [Bulinus truncatus]